jgi:protein gp37
MKRWGKQNPIHICPSEFHCDLGEGKIIFVVSGSDLFADDVPEEWISDTLAYCKSFDNTYLFQSKNPARMSYYLLRGFFPDKSIFCTTIESNRFYPEIMNKSPKPHFRAAYMHRISNLAKTYVTIEPILDFELEEMVSLIKLCQPQQVNIGADSGNNHLPEPPKEKILALIEELKKFTVINQKRNLVRLLK